MSFILSRIIYILSRLSTYYNTLRITAAYGANWTRDIVRMSFSKSLGSEPSKDSKDIENIPENLINPDQKSIEMQQSGSTSSDIKLNMNIELKKKDVYNDNMEKEMTQDNNYKARYESQVKVNTELNDKSIELQNELKKKDVYIDNMEKEMTHLKDEIAHEENEDDLNRQIMTLTNQLTRNNQKMAELEDELKKKEDFIKNMDKEITQFKGQMTELNAEQMEQLKQANEKFYEMDKWYQNRIAGLHDKEKCDRDDRMRQEEFYRKQLTDLYAELKEAEEAKDRALRRLSKIAGARLTDGNPNIADLSDQNRPTKISEMFSELYDNEWTDACAEIEQQGVQEKMAITEMLHLLMQAFHFCKKAAADHLRSMQQSVIDPFCGGRTPDVAQNAVTPDQGQSPPQCPLPDLPVEVNKQLKDIRKTMAQSFTTAIQQRFIEHIASPYAIMDKMSVFIHKCVNLCWLMGIQDPQLFLYDNCLEHSKFDRGFFNYYTKSGTHVEYLVWPALMLHENGSVLQKGVAQGC